MTHKLLLATFVCCGLLGSSARAAGHGAEAEEAGAGASEAQLQSNSLMGATLKLRRALVFHPGKTIYRLGQPHPFEESTDPAFKFDKCYVRIERSSSPEAETSAKIFSSGRSFQINEDEYLDDNMSMKVTEPTPPARSSGIKLTEVSCQKAPRPTEQVPDPDLVACTREQCESLLSELFIVKKKVFQGTEAGPNVRDIPDRVRNAI